MDELIYEYCFYAIDQNVLTSQSCLMENKDRFLREIYKHMNQEAQDVLRQANEFDLPKLFEKTRAQITGILIHFNQYTMNPLYHRLELNQNESDNDNHWITSDMIQEFISIINHTEKEEHNIQRLLDLSK